MTELPVVVMIEDRSVIAVLLARGGVALGQAAAKDLFEEAKSRLGEEATAIFARPGQAKAQELPAQFEFTITCSPPVLKVLGDEAGLQARFTERLIEHARHDSRGGFNAPPK